MNKKISEPVYEYQFAYEVILPSGTKMESNPRNYQHTTSWKRNEAQALGEADMRAMALHLRADVKILGRARRVVGEL